MLLGCARSALGPDELRRGDLVSVLPEFSPAATPLNLVHLGGRYVTPRTRAFIDFVRPRLATLLDAPAG